MVKKSQNNYHMLKKSNDFEVDYENKSKGHSLKYGHNEPWKKLQDYMEQPNHPGERNPK
ncbi:5790_t:CDS:1, partial [Entrophospora sp. SA101]